MPLPYYPRPKMATNIGRQKRKIGSPWNEAICTWGPMCFFFSFRWGCWTFVVPNVLPWNSHYVLIKFLMSSQHGSQVSNVFVNMFLIILHFISYPFLPRYKFHSSNLYQQPEGGDDNISILGLSKAWLILLWWAYMPMTKEKKSNFGDPHN
jgi:hypothetical protein